MLKSFFITLLFFCFGIVTNAQNQKMPGQSEFEMAEDLFLAKKYTAWVSILEMAVVKNHPKATVRKGDAYFLGLGVEKNYSEALNWYKKAAELNNLDALYLIGMIYKDSLIKGKTYADAVEYYLVLNEKGIVATNMLIGEAYLNGKGVEKNIITARLWFEKGVAESDPGSVYNMGYLYQKGIGVKANMEKAVELMEQSCDSNYLRACETLGELYYKGEDVEANSEKSVNWYTKGMELNGAKSHFYYSNYILLGYIEGKKADALSHAKKAKELGYDAVACDWLQLKINGEMHE